MKNFSLLHVALMTVFVSSTPVSFAEYVDSTQLTPQSQDLEVSDGNLENPDRTYAVYWGNQHKLKILASDISATAKRNAIWVNTSSYADIGNNGNVHLIAGSETSSLENINTLFAETDSTINLYGKNVIIDAISDGTQSVNAIKAKLAGSDLPSSITIGSEQTESISINAKGNHSSFGILNLGSSINLQANDVSIKSSGHGIGNNAVTPQPSLSSFTTVKANNVSIDAEGYGITNNGSKLEIEANTLTINSGMGMHVGNSTSDKKPTGSDYATTTIIANQTTINAETHGILAFSNGIVDISGNLTVNAPIAIDVRGYSTVNINQGGQSTVVLNGDISFETPGGENQSGSDIDAYVNINLTGAGSSWTGNVKKEYPATAEGDDSTSVTGLKLSLSNGAQWNPTIIDDWSEDFGETTLVGTVQALNNLNLDGGIINLSHGSDQTVNVENLTGSGGTVNLLTTVGSDGTLSTGGINFAKVEGVPSLVVNYTGITADDVNSGTLGDIKGEGVTATEGSFREIKSVSQGAIRGEITETYDENGELLFRTVAENTRLDAYGSVAALSIMQWRHEMNDLTKRMGELRTSPEGIGSWARIYGSEQEYGSQNLTAKNTSVQIGADTDVGNGWKVGAAFTYTDGSADYDLGDADNKAYGLGVYGTWMAENGQFVDLIAKYSRLDTDFKLEGMNGSSDNNAFSVSAEYGWHLRLGEFGFFEPQAEVTYGYIQGDKFHTSNGVEIDQDDFESLIGRIGFRTGFHFPKDKGLIYARVSGLHDFKGDFDSTATLMSDRSIYDNIGEDLGDTWVEFGIGANFNWTPSTYTYVDLERTNGGDVKENWRWNIGLRHVF